MRTEQEALDTMVLFYCVGKCWGRDSSGRQTFKPFTAPMLQEFVDKVLKACGFTKASASQTIENMAERGFVEFYGHATFNNAPHNVLRGE